MAKTEDGTVHQEIVKGKVTLDRVEGRRANRGMGCIDVLLHVDH